MLNILIAILIFGFLILIHELGHFVVARLCKVKVNEFSIGMGPKLVQKKSGKTGIAYTLRLLPIGGYVSMEGEEEDSECENSYSKKPIWQRFLITVAGAVMNLLVGIIITCVIVGRLSAYASTEIAGFAENSVSQASGLQEGDVIVKIGGTRIHTYYDLSYTISHDAVEKIDVTVIRDGERVVVPDVGFPTETVAGVTLARWDFSLCREDKTFGNTIKHAFWQSVTSVRMIWDSLIDLVTGRYGVEAMSGPIGITSEIGAAVEADDGGAYLLSLTALIALNLGVFNLLPIPVLDGGNILFMLIELIRRKPLKRETEGMLKFITFALLMLLMLFVTFQDISKLVK